MRCAYHVEREAVATCSVCGRGLCQECANKINPPQCLGCFADGLEAQKKQIIKSLVLAAVAAVVVFIIAMDEGAELPASFLFALAPFGWIALNKITPSFFLFMPIIGWVIYFIFKLILSMMVGIVALPYKIVKSMAQIKEINQQLTVVRGMEI